MAEIVADAQAQGASIVSGGEREDCPGNFWQPTILADVPLSARVMNDEPFGPVAAIARFATLDEAVEQANRLPFGLAAFAFTENARRANIIADSIDAGMVGINTTGLAAADAPFGGVKQSGHGAEDGPEGLMACMVTKTIHQV
jgi:succinate-semialdehyde dehydrogenase/glutarate-semialdehyde dehydrogenase